MPGVIRPIPETYPADSVGNCSAARRGAEPKTLFSRALHAVAGQRNQRSV